MSDHWEELASAYVDGETSTEESALVEATPEAMRLVEGFRTIAGRTADTPPPDPTTRSTHLAAAMAAFDDLDAVPTRLAVAADAGVVVPFRRRRWLDPALVVRAAAALFVVAGVGYAVRQSATGTDDDLATDAAPSAEFADEATAADSSGGTESFASAESATEETTTAPALQLDGDDASGAEEAEGDQAEGDIAAGGDIETESSALPSFDRTRSPLQILAELDLAPVDTLRSDPILTCVEPLGLGAADSITAIVYEGSAADLVVYSQPVQRAVIVGADCAILADESAG